MSRRVCCLYCVEKSTMFAVPKAEPRRSQWLTFLFNTVPADLPAGTVVCARHFTDQSFKNLKMFSFGLAVKLILEDDAVPTLFGPAGDSGTQPSTSQQEHNTNCSSTVGCQTDRPQTVCVGTQRVETRSVGTQTVECKVSAISVATQLARGTLKSAHVRSKVYVGELMRLVFEEVFEDPTPFVEEMNKINIPKDLSTQFDRPSKEEVVARHVSRFSLGAVGSPLTVQPDQGTPGVSGGPHTTG
ncbi:uncharacterized protein LOC117553079 [Gymnodraco acuticeps]|uniref:Uncharacterized protein LOC117553079 n=1 Tax=Gymnodraco acuticeps TaxID=8218 RepID=A0A6P8VAL2_GYMAC|nr:uncharacterized protein LOC117553079 [Gymnodraco acuticeps]